MHTISAKTRRRLAVALLGLGAVLAQPGRGQEQAGCAGVSDLMLVNGRIHTMDAAGTVVEAVRIIEDRFAAVGAAATPGECSRTLDLRGRTVIPGIIDNHNHILLLGLRPGHDTRLGGARSIPQALQTLVERSRSVPAGEWLTAIGGFDPRQFTAPPEAPRLPSLEELDQALPDHPVLVLQGFAGPAVTNSAGRAFFLEQGIEVGEDGALAGGGLPNPSTRALFELRQLQDAEDRRQGLLDALSYAASLGITTHVDQGGFPATGTAADGAAHFDPVSGYEPVLALHREGRLINRIRINFLHMDTDPATPGLRARLENAFPEFGGGMLKVLGIGEFTAGASPIVFQATEEWLNGTRLVAEAGWRNENHSLTQGDYRTIIDGWEQVHRAMEAPGIAELGWVLAHAPFIDRDYTEKLKAMGGGVSVLGGWRWISGTAEANGPPLRMLVDSGIPVGMSSDGMQVAPMNPWIGLYYAVTGRNARGEAINQGQTLERGEALRLYTAANGWFLREQEVLGSIEAGKYADLAVLSADYFDAEAVSDEEILDIEAVLTVVGGRIVHGSGEDL